VSAATVCAAGVRAGRADAAGPIENRDPGGVDPLVTTPGGVAER